VEDACREEESGVHGELAAQGVGAAAGCVTVSRWQWHGELASHLKLIGLVGLLGGPRGSKQEHYKR